jgi:hypothetical protein
MKCASAEFVDLGRKDCKECLVTDDRDSIPGSRRNVVSLHYYVQTGSGYFQSLQSLTIFWKIKSFWDLKLATHCTGTVCAHAWWEHLRWHCACPCGDPVLVGPRC